jgi:hypothetical protein
MDKNTVVQMFPVIKALLQSTGNVVKKNSILQIITLLPQPNKQPKTT